jgi:uncharacterized phage protein (TIGR01671 family)
MRTIKFRAWDKRLNKMITAENVEVMCNNQSETPYEYHSDEWYPAEVINGLFLYFQDIVGNENFIVEQFTGLTDKNGKEVYEGDIVRHDNDCEDTIIFGNIGYDSARNGLTGFGYASHYDDDYDFIELYYGDSPKDIEVIGNIHTTKEG